MTGAWMEKEEHLTNNQPEEYPKESKRETWNHVVRRDGERPKKNEDRQMKKKHNK